MYITESLHVMVKWCGDGGVETGNFYKIMDLITVYRYN